ncbi:MAG TPA: nucleotidyl transferase AbiEii/AbiGii toxin family protein [Kofleriaceae bacterium]|nr:nucleotidyl transferase AbiEii/AbiGii toxin family protein [Kofleriaceae bacterium]
MTPRSYRTPLAFKTALEDRLRAASRGQFDLERRRQLLVFHRFLARVAEQFGDSITLKGGLVLELRLARARTTRDVDLRATGDPRELLERLRAAAQSALGDYLTYEVQPDPDQPQIQNAGMKYDGERYRVECKLAGRTYGRRFGVDVAFADPILGAPDVIEVENVLGFAGIAAPKLRLYPVETHIAEKLHAYTLPRDYLNSRVKDLPDLALLATVRVLEGERVRAAIAQTFDHRATHAVPTRVPQPPPEWAETYAEMASEFDLEWRDLDTVTDAVARFLDPVLAGSHIARWDQRAWSWSEP